MPKTDEVLVANKPGIQCPACGHTESCVYITGRADNAISRRRKCDSCGERFGTIEHATRSPGIFLQGVAAVSLSETANKLIAQAIKTKRAALLMTQKDLATRLGVSPHTVTQIERTGVLLPKLQQVVCSWLLSDK